ncbi:glucose-6-phosphate isomerase [Candidatus Pelagibacter sp.]|nr:glucose-6-phosphate isomerase [Candidatus Pelagibacter bacterium]MDC0397965.1 glucose-6-phosphate isomerase [Candidatus Pelagibacter sp.]MDC0900659.1 glucose-6-phosphate isomerase [Candidatus Pelagibacter sp.]MDC1069709.1 glucose-6-phosphate isomerase [Candidatus Pelagibacter sp.]
MLTKNVKFTNFKIKKNSLLIKKKLISLLKSKNEILNSLSQNYKDNFTKKILLKYKKNTDYRVIGMGGSSIGTQTIYDFLKHKIKKKFVFSDNLQVNLIKDKKKYTNLIVSKSGNTIETIVNANIFIKKKDRNIFITESKNSYLLNLAKKLKSDIIHHNNYIGGRYSVLSEVGMLPAELMGLKASNFRQLNNLIKNKQFINSLISNVSSTLYFIKKKKFNSIIINYDERSENLFNWYQQLIAESLGKKKKGLLPIVSNMPKDNHSTMQLYLDGFKNNFFTFFYVNEKNSEKIKNNTILSSQYYLKNKNLSQVTLAQKKATENVFKNKNIPFRSFEIKNRDEKTLGELFCFFILETILIGQSMNLNPYDQPAVELIKVETKKLLIKNS